MNYSLNGTFHTWALKKCIFRPDGRCRRPGNIAEFANQRLIVEAMRLILIMLGLPCSLSSPGLFGVPGLPGLIGLLGLPGSPMFLARCDCLSFWARLACLVSLDFLLALLTTLGWASRLAGLAWQQPAGCCSSSCFILTYRIVVALPSGCGGIDMPCKIPVLTRFPHFGSSCA